MAADGLPVTWEQVAADRRGRRRSGGRTSPPRWSSSGVVAHGRRRLHRTAARPAAVPRAQARPDPCTASGWSPGPAGSPSSPTRWPRARRVRRRRRDRRELAAAGLDGIEVDHMDHAAEDRAHLRGLAARPRAAGHRLQRLPRQPQDARSASHRRRAGAHARGPGVRGAGPRADAGPPGRPADAACAGPDVLFDAAVFGELVRHPLRDHGPAGITPIFLALTAGRRRQGAAADGLAGGRRRLRRDRRRSALFGQQILDYLHVSVPALMIAGGLLLLLIALDLLTGKTDEPTADQGRQRGARPAGHAAAGRARRDRLGHPRRAERGQRRPTRSRSGARSSRCTWCCG